MSEEAFVRAVLDEPDEDAPRLVMADWYEENGQTERAAFIRLQVEHARLHPGDPRRPELKVQADRLLKDHQESWLGPLRQGLNGPRPRQFLASTFRRGLLEEVGLRAGRRDFLQGAGPALASHPLLRLTLSGSCPAVIDTAVADLAEAPELHGLRRLRLDTPPASEDALGLLGSSAHLRRLEGLFLNWTESQTVTSFSVSSTAFALAALAGTPLAGRLRSLTAALGDGDGDTAVGLLGASPTFPSLLSLDLTVAGAGDVALGRLARSSHLGGLRELGVRGHVVGLGELLASPLWGRLTRLLLYRCRIDDPGRLAAALPGSSLAALSLEWCDGTPGFVAELLGLPSWGALRELELSGVDLTWAAGVGLVGSPHVAGLSRLSLSRSRLGDAAARALANSQHAGGLREVVFPVAGLSKVGRQALRRRFGDALCLGP